MAGNRNTASRLEHSLQVRGTPAQVAEADTPAGLSRAPPHVSYKQPRTYR
jgi:hypothetical protein